MTKYAMEAAELAAETDTVVGAAAGYGAFLELAYQHHYPLDYANDFGFANIDPRITPSNTTVQGTDAAPDANVADILAQQSASVFSTSASSNPYPVVNNPSTNPNPVSTNSFTQLT